MQGPIVGSSASEWFQLPHAATGIKSLLMALHHVHSTEMYNLKTGSQQHYMLMLPTPVTAWMLQSNVLCAELGGSQWRSISKASTIISDELVAC